MAASLAASVLFISCEKTRPELTGSASIAGFTFATDAVPDTLPFTPRVTFTNTSTEEFLYQWQFGDNSPLSSEKSPVHTFSTGGTFNVTLTTAGTNGNNSITKIVGVPDACQNDFFSKLTGCSANEWTWSSDGDAIKVLSPDATQVYFAGAPAVCQADDVYKFEKTGTFTYNANGQTFDVQSGYSCQAPKANAAKFKVIARAGQQPKIVLDPLASGTGRPFIGTTDLVDSNTYTVQAYTETTLVLRATIEGSGGTILEIKLKKSVAQTIDDIKNLLTGGSSKSWKLDPANGANTIIVGTEGNPSEYFGGGPIDGCQMDDVYTFSAANQLNYNANGATFNGGNIAPNYNCGSDRSYNVAYTFGATTGGRAGLATIQLPSAPPVTFIGTTDVPNENTYRIIDITPTTMVLRAGNGSGTVFQFKFIAQ